jgi:arylsulfatase A-like enzyme
MPGPNIVLILADDLGFSDVGSYGGEIRTPHIDRLAHTGVRMAQFYNTARCSPSRASLLTGKHPHEAGIGVLTRPSLPDGYPGDLALGTATVAELLARAGWRTWMSGKWHLSANARTPNQSWPTRRGFERFFGTLAGCSSYFDPQTLTRGEEPAADAAGGNFYYTDAISDEAVGWVDQWSAETERDPFFLYLAYTAPHWPLHAKAEDLAANRGRFDLGWDQLRADRLRRLKEEGLLGSDVELSGRDPSQPAWDKAPDQEWQASRMEAYAAQVEAMDRGIGRVLDAVERAGELDETLVIFLSDNGGCAEELPIGPIETFRLKDDALQQDAPSGLPLQVGNSPDTVPGAEDTYASYGIPWANLSNTPFRQYKRWVHEGGIATPFIARWPAGGLVGGRVVQPAYQLVNIVPTLLEATGVHPDDFVPEGGSMLPALRGEDVEEATLYWEHIGNAAIRRGPWKLVRDHPTPWELYDIHADRTELHDVATDHPDVVEELGADWHRWAERVGVVGWEHMLDLAARAGEPAASAEE